MVLGLFILAMYFYACEVPIHFIVAAFCQNMLLEYHYTAWFQEVGWDSNEPGYDGLIEVVNRLLMKGRTRADTIEAAVYQITVLFLLLPPI